MVGLISNWPFQKRFIELGSLGNRHNLKKKKKVTIFKVTVENQTKLSALISEAAVQT